MARMTGKQGQDQLWGGQTFNEFWKTSDPYKWLQNNWQGIERRGMYEPPVFLGINEATGERITARDKQEAVYMKKYLQDNNISVIPNKEGDTPPPPGS